MPAAPIDADVFAHHTLSYERYLDGAVLGSQVVV